MNIRSAKHSYHGQEGKAARVVNAAIAGVMVLVLMLAVWSAPRETAASAPDAQGVEAGYFPAQFPSPEGAPETPAPTF